MEKLKLAFSLRRRSTVLKGVGRANRQATAVQDVFAQEIVAGLETEPKSLPSKYLYDSRGDELFKQITTLPEYYLTRCEEEILFTHAWKIAEITRAFKVPFRLVELGPGDGDKTKILLREFTRQDVAFTYHPIDISSHVLGVLKENVNTEFPSLDIRPVAADYMEALEEIGRSDRAPSMILFMGGNIGNYTKEQAAGFLTLLAKRMRGGDMLMCGFDLKKDPAIIYHAYNDRQGVTRSFTFNLLRRINRELGADFDGDNFLHYPTYDPLSGEMKSYLISGKAQTVSIRSVSKKFHFAAWEPVLMEVSNKYAQPEITRMCLAAGLTADRFLFDKKKYYVVAILKKK